MESKQCFASAYHKNRPTSCLLFIIFNSFLQCLELNLRLQAHYHRAIISIHLLSFQIMLHLLKKTKATLTSPQQITGLNKQLITPFSKPALVHPLPLGLTAYTQTLYISVIAVYLSWCYRSSLAVTGKLAFAPSEFVVQCNWNQNMPFWSLTWGDYSKGRFLGLGLDPLNLLIQGTELWNLHLQYHYPKIFMPT